MEELRSMYELPCVVHFITCNKPKYNFPEFDITAFEEGLTDSESLLPQAILACLLRTHLKDEDIRIKNVEEHLKVKMKDRQAQFNPLASSELKDLQPSQKLKLIKWTIDLTKSKTAQTLDELLDEDIESELDSTVINVGQDSDKFTYLYFDDLRLYRHKAGQPRSAVDWRCVATDQTAWEALIQTFSSSSDELEKELYSYLNDHLYPPLKGLLEAQKPRRVTNEELFAHELSPASIAMNPEEAERIMSANPELSKVLSEAPRPANPQTNGLADGQKSGGVAFTQQQSQLFVFTTSMANRAADAINAGQFSSILAYHLEDPDTKAFLQANPMKVSLPTPQSRLNIPLAKGRAPSSAHQRRMPMDGEKHGFPDIDYNSPVSQSPDISTQYVPSENLTPEQRQKREDGLASLRKIHQMLLDTSEPQTDFSHINMAQDHQGYAPSSNTFGISSAPYGFNRPPMLQYTGPRYPGPPSAGQAMGPGHGYYNGPSVSPIGNHVMMDNHPPPPYPAIPEPSPPERRKKVGRKRKSISSVSPASPLQSKSPKSAAMQPSPLTQYGSPLNSQMHPNDGASQYPGGPQFPGSVGSPAQQPNYGHPQPSARLMAGEPVPYQSVAGYPENMVAPPSHPQKYESLEFEERHIHQIPNTGQPPLTAQSTQALPPTSCSMDIKMNGRGMPPASEPQMIDAKVNPASITDIARLQSINETGRLVDDNLSQIRQKTGPAFDGDKPQLSSGAQAEPPSDLSRAPRVNNTFVNTHMSIGQLNIQNVTATQNQEGGGGAHMQQNLDVSMNNFNVPGSNTFEPPTSGFSGPAYRQPFPQPPPGSVRIQNKGPNTIQYLPVSSQSALPPSHSPALPPKNMEYPPGGPLPQAVRHEYKPPSYPPQGGFPNMTVQERPPAGHQFMSQQLSQHSMSVNYPGSYPGHPGVMESHHMHMRRQQMVSHNQYAPPPGGGAYMPPDAGYPPQGSHYGPAGHQIMAHRMHAPMHPHQAAPPQGYMGGPQPPAPHYM